MWFLWKHYFEWYWEFTRVLPEYIQVNGLQMIPGLKWCPGIEFISWDPLTFVVCELNETCLNHLLPHIPIIHLDANVSSTDGIYAMKIYKIADIIWQFICILEIPVFTLGSSGILLHSAYCCLREANYMPNQTTLTYWANNNLQMQMHGYCCKNRVSYQAR